MALHTLNKLSYKLANLISSLVNDGYKIDPYRSCSNDVFFRATLTNGRFTVRIIDDIDVSNNTLTRVIKIQSSDSRFNIDDKVLHYYRVHDNIYADSKEEADREHKKWLAVNLGLGDIDCKDPIQAFADMLGNHISKCLRGDK